jgi:hypothetical protein
MIGEEEWIKRQRNKVMVEDLERHNETLRNLIKMMEIEPVSDEVKRK